MSNKAVDKLLVRQLGLVAYQPTLERMQHFTELRTSDTADELWLLQHPPVFTQGLSGKAEHVLNAGDIPVVPIDRGGQVTYHGPGQLVGYLLLDLRRLNLGVRTLVRLIEASIIELLARYEIEAVGREDAPGVYVDGRKIASLGLRVRRGCTYHGLSLNTQMDLEPFSRINPCGYPGLEVTQLSALGGPDNVDQTGHELAQILARQLGYAGLRETGTDNGQH